MAGAAPPEVAALEQFGEEIGLAFQIVDDILDEIGTSGELGKTAGKDRAEGKPTYPALFGLEASKAMARAHVARQLMKLGGRPVLREGFVTDNGNLILVGQGGVHLAASTGADLGQQ